MRTFSEVALCHLPEDEIRWAIELNPGSFIYSNQAGFFIWAKAKVAPPVLTQILAAATTDYVLFDVDVEPDPELEVFDD